MKAVVYSTKGVKSKTETTLEPSVFDDKINEALLAQAVYVYLSNQRQANAHTKSRGDVRGGGRKPWRQKGTGRARHGSTRSPIWKGGGVTFGPTNERNYKKSLSKKMKKQAMRSAFTYLAKQGMVHVIDGYDISEVKATASLSNIITNTGISGDVLLVEAGVNTKLLKAAGNLEGVKVTPVNELNVYKLLNAGTLLINKDAVETITKYWGGKKETKKISVKPETKKQLAVKVPVKKAKPGVKKAAKAKNVVKATKAVKKISKK